MIPSRTLGLNGPVLVMRQKKKNHPGQNKQGKKETEPGLSGMQASGPAGRMAKSCGDFVFWVWRAASTVVGAGHGL